MKSNVSTKEVFSSDNWIITKIIFGEGIVRIDARKRFHEADEPDFFSKWVSNNYADSLARYYYGKTCSQFNCAQL